MTGTAQQGPSISWQKCYGGSGDDELYSITRSAGGGFIACGLSTSNDGDVSGHHGATGVADAWVVALAPDGTLQWQKSLGGSGADNLVRIIGTMDGGYIAVGNTASNDGDVSGLHGATDVWVVKLNNTGNIQWQKCLGGSGADQGNSILQTADGGYILIGTTASNDGDVSGLHGGKDSWVVKLDGSGNLQWQKCYGSTGDDEGNDITAMANGEFLLAVDNPSGTYNGDYVGFGGNSYPNGYLLKIDGSGALKTGIWCNQFSRGLGAIAVNSQLYYGLSTRESCYPSGPANWVYVLGLDSNLATGYGGDQFGYCPPSTNPLVAGYVLTGANGATVLLSNGSGVVAQATTDTTHLGNHGATDGYLGNFLSHTWGKCYGGSGTDYFTALASPDDFTFVAGGYTNSNDGDVSGNHGGYDFWIVKLSNFNVIKGTVFLDYNRNGARDGNEPVVNNMLVQSVKGGSSSASLTTHGQFDNIADTGTYTTSVLTSVPYYSATPASHTSTFSGYNLADSFGIALQPVAGKRDYLLNLYALNYLRIGDSATYEIAYVNAGTDTLQNRVVQLIKDHRTSYLGSTPSALSVSGDTIRWNIASLSPRDTGSIRVVLKLGVPPVLNLTDTLVTSATIDTAGDLNQTNNTATLQQLVFGSYDPNEKTEADAGLVYVEDLAKGKYLQYTIQFQNTGNDTAFNITVADTLSSKLDLSTFEMVGTSAPYQLTVKNGNALSWSFPGIDLLDSSKGQAVSQGYIVYRIKPVSSVQAGDSIHNSASIYFDLNLPIVTGMQVTYIKSRAVTLPVTAVITGLNPAYCVNSGAAVFKMTNFPDTTGGAVAVTAKVDNTPLTIGPGASCPILLAGLSAGVHTVQVTYTNAGGSSNYSQSFTVVSASTPVVTISATYTTIPNTAASVGVWATNVSGGGSAPLYSWSLNPRFSPLLSGPGSADSIVIDTAALQIGANTVYVRMQTSDTCYSSQTGTDSVVIIRTAPASGGGGTVTPPAQPVIAGLSATYCSNGGMANFSLSNLPDTATTVSVTLDGAVLTAVAAGQYSVALTGLSTGTHRLKVTYSNSAGSNAVSPTFLVEAVSAPVVSIHAAYTTLPVTAASVLVTATDVSGGGSEPLYSWSLNPAFSPVLRGPGSADSLVIDTAALAVGSNTVYVRMVSSDSCVTSQMAADSVVITRLASGGGVANDSGAAVGANPNPFRDRVIVTGLQPADGYTITLLNSNGVEIVKVRVTGVTQTQLTPGPMTSIGIYLLRVYDETRGTVTRVVRMLAVGGN